MFKKNRTKKTTVKCIVNCDPSDKYPPQVIKLNEIQTHYVMDLSVFQTMSVRQKKLLLGQYQPTLIFIRNNPYQASCGHQIAGWIIRDFKRGEKFSRIADELKSMIHYLSATVQCCEYVISFEPLPNNRRAGELPSATFYRQCCRLGEDKEAADNGLAENIRIANDYLRKVVNRSEYDDVRLSIQLNTKVGTKIHSAMDTLKEVQGSTGANA